MGNLREFSLGGVINVTNGKLHGKKWNSLFIKICNGETDHAQKKEEQKEYYLKTKLCKIERNSLLEKYLRVNSVLLEP
jgi:hypothetical protein